jgi:ABC-type glycerol-3-phosphate transport system substrate-binding protein
MKLSLFNIIILIVAGFAIIGAVLIFAFGLGTNKPIIGGIKPVVIWGDLPLEVFDTLQKDPSIKDSSKYQHITYVEKDSNTLEQEFIEALAEGKEPDLVIFRENQIFKNQNKLYITPYKSVDKRTFQDTFIPESDLLLSKEGIVGFPIVIDPLVMYFNKDILNSAGIIKTPETWKELLAIAPSLIKSDSAFNISKAVIPLGSTENIKNSKEIIWSLILQTGNTVVERRQTEEGQELFAVTLSEKGVYSSSPAIAAINFFNQFSNPTKDVYSWNRSLPDSQDYFLAGNSAFYLGFASELPLIKRKNPNLNLDVAVIPQSQLSESVSFKSTYGKMYFIGMVKKSKNLDSAFRTAVLLSEQSAQDSLSKILGLPPVRRDLLDKFNPSNSFDSIFKKSALIADGVIEPNSIETTQIINKMIQSVQSGELETNSSIIRATNQLIKLFE